MIRNFNIYVNPTLGSIVSTEGDASFYLGDNNQITVIPDTQEELLISISGNIPGSGTYIAELIKDNNNYILKDKDMDTFLQKVGTVNCNIHISNTNGERLTTLPFQMISKLAYDREGSTIVTQTTAITLEDFYVAYAAIQNLNIEEVEAAVAVVESLDIQKIEEALEIVDSLDGKVEELDQTIANAKETDTELAATLTLIRGMLESGALKGEPGEPGYTPQKGIDYFDGEPGEPGKDFKYEDFTPEQLAALKGEPGEKGDPGGKGDPGDDYILTENDKTEIANQVYAMLTNGEEVRF